MVIAFFDPVCRDNKDAWPSLKQALEHYGSRVSLAFALSISFLFCKIFQFLMCNLFNFFMIWAI
ncbi:hypothetical protein Patl1_37423 [Pistacia atlantica]|nr:hypothetical protein Patl1_37423 [Pistacia atlantica]